MAKAKTTKKKTTTKAKSAKNLELLLVGSKVKQTIRDQDCNTGGDAIDGLNKWVHWLINQAAARASANGRKTVRAHDFMV